MKTSILYPLFYSISTILNKTLEVHSENKSLSYNPNYKNSMNNSSLFNSRSITLKIPTLKGIIRRSSSQDIVNRVKMHESNNNLKVDQYVEQSK